MIIHTIVYNNLLYNNITNIKLNNVIVWTFDNIILLITNKYPSFLYYFKNLILNKSRENLAKYIILKEYGGFFINYYILYNLTIIENNKIIKLLETKYDIIFWKEKDQTKICIEVLNFDENIINDDIIIIKNPNNDFINYLLSNINKNIFPNNEFTNKNVLGNIFLSNILYKFYNYELNYDLNSKSFYFFNLFKKNHKYNKNIYNIIIKNKIFVDTNYKKKLYPNIISLLDPELILNSWDNYYKALDIISNIFIIYFSNYEDWTYLLNTILITTVSKYIIKEIISSKLDICLKRADIDSKIFFYPQKFKIFKELQKNWKIIRDEALYVLNNAPKLDMSRTYYDWHNAESYVNTIINKYGWIRSWKYEDVDNNLSNNLSNNLLIENQNIEGNYEWLNYGLFYFQKEFNENLKACPKTYSFLNKIKEHINICGFSYMLGNCILQPHTDITGISSNSLAFHLGLSIPEPNETCKIFIKNENNEFVYMTEKNGKIIFFILTSKFNNFYNHKII